MLIHHPLSFIKARFKILEKIAIKNSTSRSNSTSVLKSLIHNMANDKDIPRWVKGIDSQSMRLLTHVLTENSHLHAFKSKLDPNISPLCPLCNFETETSYHFLCTCPYHADIRAAILGDRVISLLHLYGSPITKICQFIKATDRFLEL